MAIVMVVVYHVILMSPVPLWAAMRWTKPGQYGVDLFFVLSGWLIGGLFWQEHARHGNVEAGRFWLRRSLRTVPPYYVALGLAWGAVYAQRREPFAWSYLVFAQNYRAEIPFFLVSWSLCIEEHFYAFIPLTLTLLGRAWRVMAVLLAVFIVAAPIGRWLDPGAAVHVYFGYGWTATHLRLEGLLLGFSAAAVPVFRSGLWTRVQQHRNVLLVLAGELLVLGVALPEPAQYHVGASLLALGFLGLLVTLVDRPPHPFAASGIVRAVAGASYSIYLVHSLVLHAARVVTGRLPASAWPVYFAVAIGLIAVTSAVFHIVVERTAIAWRDRIVPRRTRTESRPTSAVV